MQWHRHIIVLILRILSYFYCRSHNSFLPFYYFSREIHRMCAGCRTASQLCLFHILFLSIICKTPITPYFSLWIWTRWRLPISASGIKHAKKPKHIFSSDRYRQSVVVELNLLVVAVMPGWSDWTSTNNRRRLIIYLCCNLWIIIMGNF